MTFAPGVAIRKLKVYLLQNKIFTHHFDPKKKDIYASYKMFNDVTHYIEIKFRPNRLILGELTLLD